MRYNISFAFGQQLPFKLVNYIKQMLLAWKYRMMTLKMCMSDKRSKYRKILKLPQLVNNS
jgi:hypothetical protein